MPGSCLTVIPSMPAAPLRCGHETSDLLALSFNPLSGTVWAFSRHPGLLCPLLTSASRSEHLAASSVPKDTVQISRSKPDGLHRTPAGFTVLAFDGNGLRECLPARPTSAASYPLSVRRVATLLHASFRQSLAVPPLRFASASPPSGCTGDFHPQSCRTCPTHRLALRAPALHAATALTRPSRSAQRLPCGRQNVPTAKTVGPNNVVANLCVEHGDHLTHHGHDHDLRQLAGGRETVVERLEHRIPIAGAHRRHVKHLADVRPPAPDAAPSLERAALEGVGSDADQRSDLLAAHAAKLGQQRNQRAGQYCADSWHRREQAIAVDECILGGNDLDHALVEQVDVGGEANNAAARKTPQHRIFQQSGGILGGNFLGAELAANGEHLGQRSAAGVC